MEIPVYDLTGTVVKQINVSDSVFGVAMNEALVHQAMVRQQANARQGTADTKTRGEVEGSQRKLYAQKHTGRARAGDLRSPTRRHGGITFGPHPRDYRQGMPKKMRQLALRCVLSDKAAGGNLKVLTQLEMDAPKTRQMATVLSALGADNSALIATNEPPLSVIKSARNIPGVKTLPTNLLNVVDLLSHRTLVMTEASVRRAEELWGQAEGEDHATA